MLRSEERGSVRRRLIGVLAVGTACAGGAVAVGATGAIGAGVESSSLTTRQASVTLAPEATATRAPRCPAGRRAVSGGFANSNFDPAGPRAITYVSRRQQQRRWRTSVYNEAPLGAATVRVFTYCERIGRLKPRRATTTIEPLPGVGSAVATCPKGHRAVSGGFANPDFTTNSGPRVVANLSRNAGQRRWRVSAPNISPNGPGTLHAFAYCLKTGKRVVTRAAQTTVQSGGTNAVTAKCPRNRRLISGGFAAPPYSLGAVGILPYISRKAGRRGWRVAGWNNGVANGNLRAFAHCL